MDESTVMTQLGEDGLSALIATFYHHMRDDDLVGKMYPSDDWQGSELRFRDFMVFRFGGSTKYIEERGHPRLRMRHMHFKVDIAARDRWMEIMTKAMDEREVPSPSKEILHQFFSQTADFMRNVSD